MWSHLTATQHTDTTMSSLKRLADKNLNVMRGSVKWMDGSLGGWGGGGGGGLLLKETLRGGLTGKAEDAWKDKRWIKVVPQIGRSAARATLACA